jgi:hypothetical protein
MRVLGTQTLHISVLGWDSERPGLDHNGSTLELDWQRPRVFLSAVY